jgi:hypothetical protein
MSQVGIFPFSIVVAANESEPRMINFAKVATFTGIGLLILAWVTAGLIPNQSRHDFDRLVRAAGGQLSHTPTFPDTYIQLGAHRRMLQNFYIAAAGLICLGVGLTCWKRCVEVAAAPQTGVTTPVDQSGPNEQPPWTS